MEFLFFGTSFYFSLIAISKLGQDRRVENKKTGPKGLPNVAQRFNAGNVSVKIVVPEGRAYPKTCSGSYSIPWLVSRLKNSDSKVCFRWCSGWELT